MLRCWLGPIYSSPKFSGNRAHVSLPVISPLKEVFNPILSSNVDILLQMRVMSLGEYQSRQECDDAWGMSESATYYMTER